MDQGLRDQTLIYLEAGVKWFEFYNEPNLPIEWPEGTDIDWRNTSIMYPLMDNWLTWAEFVVSQGGYPGFIALAESDDPKASAVRWMDTWLQYLADRHRDRFRYVLANGAYCATHPYILNHFYQERPGGGARSARSPEQQNAYEGGWHFEYPYDPICQASDPGRTIYGGTALTPYGDPVGLTAMGRMFNERCATLFGSQAVPVLGTEGGIFPFRDLPAYQQDRRYPPYTLNSQAEGTVAMFDWISHNAPPWFFGVCLWKEDEYYEYDVPTARRLRETAPVPKNVPAISVMADGYGGELLGTLVAEVPGPGPIHGQADFHMVILAPGLDPDLFFNHAAGYWSIFRPIVTTNIELVDYVPKEKSLAVTVISPDAFVQAMTERIQVQYPNVWFDLIVADDIQRVADIFATRA
ncbi:MAG: hypothetical protein K8I60_11385, partial [Anaerolineae bacterium]|nr:hypothetical protein [Anaerolineae bacterium]